jgi:protein-S-isoprenylcysteine O-methyltransferase Ste14
VFTLARALAYAALFISTVLVALPAEVLRRTGVVRPALGAAQVAGGIAVALGAALMLTCVLTFALLGRGTPAPFDPPQRLVRRGPYRVVRNPMYVGAILALAGAALAYESWPLAILAALFALAAHLLVCLYEEPTLRRRFGADYDDYRARVGRWHPRLRSPDSRLRPGRPAAAAR